MKNQSKRATVYFDSQLHRVLRLKAAETHRSVSAIINDAVRQCLAEDAEDLAAFELRASEPNLVFEKVLQDMKKRGQI
jgi:plasmid stability protein